MDRDIRFPAVARPETSAGGFLLAFMVLGILAGIANGVAKVALPLYAASLHASSLEIGLVGGLQLIGVLLLSIPIGALIDPVGSRRLFFLGGIGGALVYGTIFPWAESPHHLILGVLLFGLLNPFRWVPTQAEFLHLLPQLGPRKAGWQRGAHTMGMFFLGPSAGALLLSSLGFAATFLLSAAVLLLAVLMGNRVMSGPSIPAPPVHPRVHPLERLRALLVLVIDRPALRQGMAAEFFGQIAMSYFTVFVVLMGIRRFGMEIGAAAGLVTVQGACFILALFLLGDRIAPLRESVRYLFASLFLLAAEISMAWAPSPTFLWIAAVLLGVGLGIQHLTSVARFAALTRELGRGRIGGLFSVAGPAGGLLGSVGGGLLAQHFGSASGFQAMAALYVLLLARQWGLFKAGNAS